MEFGLFYFANHEGEAHEHNKYQLILESAKWADKNHFARLWTPERHFHSFGGLSPNPSVLAAALASQTERIQICSGSVVLPLHDPIRVAEEWAVVDNISCGRVGLGVACGWVPNDFVISENQNNFNSRKQVFADNISILRKLWKGEPHCMVNPQGKEIEVQTLPRPIQSEVPMWITAAANPDTFRQAGSMGVNLLTHLLGQSLQVLTENIATYRTAWKEAGHSGKGIVTLMLHTFVADSDEEVHDLVREPMKKYLSGSLSLAAANIESVPFIRDAEKIDVDSLTPEMIDQVLEASFEKYFHMSGLMGSYDKCLDMIENVEQADVDEVACLIDFGVDENTVLANLENLNVVRILSNPRSLH